MILEIFLKDLFYFYYNYAGGKTLFWVFFAFMETFVDSKGPGIFCADVFMENQDLEHFDLTYRACHRHCQKLCCGRVWYVENVSMNYGDYMIIAWYVRFLVLLRLFMWI
jgi:hypothetical protein